MSRVLSPSGLEGHIVTRMSFSDYYNDYFRDDLRVVIAELPPGHEAGPGRAMVQPHTLSHDNPVVRRWPPEQRILFACSLFLTVLADQVCEQQFRASYA